MGWQTSASTNPDLRCSKPGPPPSLPDFTSYQYWSGDWLDVPGAGEQAMLQDPSTQLPAPATGTYPWITKSFWRISCEASTANGYPGEGFIAISPQGDKYYFDYVVQVPAASIVRGWNPGGEYSDSQNRDVVYFLVTRIEDRFGNFVTYTYSGNQLQSIQSKNGRYINLTWSGGNIVSASSNAGTWQYSYSDGALSTVTRSDGSSWSYSHTGDMAILPDNPLPVYQQIPRCTPPQVGAGAFTYRVTTPSGATAQFDFAVERHGFSNVPKYCNSFPIPGGGPNQFVSYEWLTIPNYFDTFTLTSKQVSGPGFPAAAWTYSYTGPGGFFFANACHIPDSTPACPESSTTEVTGPDGIYKRYIFGAWYDVNEGQLLEVDSGTDASHILSTATTSYSDGTSQAFPSTVGNNPRMWSDTFTTTALRPASGSVVTQDGASFMTVVNAFDVFARTTSETESSSLGYSKTDTTTYADDANRWVLGMLTQAATNGIVSAQTNYDSLDRPTSHYGFGKLVATDAWNADGTLASMTDGNNHTTSFSGWTRGLPTHVAFADGTNESATISDAGRITSITNENGATTSYQYDPMGRLKEIDYPTGPNDDWNKTLLSFAPNGGGQYGTGAGSWVQTVQTGNAVSHTYFDALWRPLVTEHYDAGHKAATLSQVVDRYDAAGRKVFVSYPLNNLGSYTATGLTGVHTAYDALGRVTEVDQDSELGTLTTTTAYLSGFQTQTTDPRGNSTLTSYQAYGQPTTKFPDSVTAPNGELTVILRDAFDKPLSITRTGTAQGSLQLTRYYVYDSHQQLCKRVDPESGATAFGYDAAGNLAWSAAGLTSLTGSTTCDASAALASGRVVNRSYDALNRVTSLTFPDGNGNQAWTYTPDGQPSTITRQNDNGSSVPVTNSYLYDQRGLLISEALTQNNTTWTVGYGHDANGHLASETYPNGLTIPFAPNALGQPTQVGSYATGVGYYPDGKVSQFTYGNGIVHTLTENARGLPAGITDSGAGVTPLQQTYTYDADGNPTAINDAANSAQNRSLAYDTLDRLVSATVGYQGTTPTTFTYDVLDNLTATSQGTHLKTLTYNTGDQLSALIDSATGTTSFTYDAQGNLASKGGQAYAFDYGNRLRWATGREGYAYDALGRRVLATASAGNQAIFSMYSHAGQLVYQQDNRNAVSHAYLYLGSRLVATVDYPFAGGNSVRYEHSDAQGSVIAETNASRTIIKTSVYSSWGGLLNHGNDDAPGYTGHLEDSLTGLTYMQQRYYDPSVGRFLSMDPVGVNTTGGGNSNRYWYAKDNPYRYTDPSGAVVEAVFEQGVSKDVAKQMISYLKTSPTFAKMYSALQNSAQTYRMAFLTSYDDGSTVHSKYMSGQHTIRINPTEGIKIKSSGKVESPAIVAAHEIAHAYQADTHTRERFAKLFLTPVRASNGTVMPLDKDNAGEEGATRTEQQVAHELGAPVRKSYTDVVPGNVGFVHTCGVTSSNACPN